MVCAHTTETFLFRFLVQVDMDGKPYHVNSVYEKDINCLFLCRADENVK